MRLYLDSSVILQRYFDDREADTVVALLQGGHALMTSALVFAETASVLRRALKGRRLTRPKFDRVKAELRKDLRHLRILGGHEELYRQAALVADQTGLRTLDALHLASARQGGAEAVATLDREMAEAAKNMGFRLAL